MKKAFSFIEVIITTMLLSVVMISLLQIKSDNIFLVNKSKETKELKEYISVALNTNDINKENKNIFLDRVFPIRDNDLRRELKRIKVKVKDKKLDTLSISQDDININIDTYIRTYSIDNKITKNIYAFKLEL